MVDQDFGSVEAEYDEIDANVLYAQAIDLGELRRFVAINLASQIGVVPDKAVALARDIERFLVGIGPKVV